MERVLLNIGCGNKKLPGFINIDIESAADIRLDVTKGLPFENNSVHGIFSEHFFEHITQAQGAAFLRECRRILAPGGVCRIATPDLDALIKEYMSENWLNPEWTQFGYNYLDNRCEMLNLALREWEHKWVYNEEELVRLGTMAGLDFGGRFQIGESSHDFLRRLEYREGSRLIIEFVKPVRIPSDSPLVSVLIPSYKIQHFRAALESALNQTFMNIEVVISDDCPTDQIQKVVAECNDKRICYNRNSPALGPFDNHLKVFSLARGEYIKFLCDDDMLHPTCIERMMKCFEQYPDATLVTSHRQCIDANGNHLPDTGATQTIVKVDSIIDGAHLVNTMLSKQLNFIGEPTTVLFRKMDLENVKPNFLSYGGRPNVGNGDMTMWVNLLGKGDAIYLVDTLSYFRQHEGQEQRQAEYADQGLRALHQLMFDAKRFGFLSEYTIKRTMSKPLLLNALHTKGFGSRKQDSESNPEPAVSVIIPVFNKVGFTRQCISAIEKVPPSCRYEVIVVDNASSDGTREYIEQVASRRTNVQVIRNERNLGFARACNQGAHHARGQHLLFLNNDTEPQDGWSDALVRILDGDSSVAAAGSKLVYADGTIQHAGVVIFDDRQIGDPLIARHAYVGQQKSLPEANKSRTYQALTAACLLVRKSAFNEVGGFDEEYWNGYEDVDLCFRLRAKGWKLVYQPASNVIHHESQSGPERMKGVSKNIQRLHQRWLGTITPDIVIMQDGRIESTESRAICEYASPERSAKLVSIIILTYNNLGYTKECFESIQRHTRCPYKVIFVDNASTDNTVEWLKSVEKITNNCRLILNGSNLGFPAGNNRALAVAHGEYLLLLNNDVVVTEGWLERLVEVAESDSTIGIVGPISNYVSGPQIDKAATYKAMDAMHAYAKSLRVRNKGEVVHFPRVAFLCTLIKRELLSKIGGLDERFSPGNFEDDDFCLRANLAGYKTVIAKDVFIHHYGSKSFLADGAEHYKARLATNGKIFTEKWGVDNETLWTQGKSVKKRSLKIPIHHDLFVQYFEQAQIHIEEKEMKLGLDALVKALSYHHTSKRTNGGVEYADVLDVAANVALTLGELQTAKGFFEEELKLAPHSSRACAGLGEVFYLAEMDQASKTMFEHAVVNDEGNVAAISGLAKANQALGLPEDDNALLVPVEVNV